MVDLTAEDLINYGCLDIVVTKKLYRWLREEYNSLGSGNRLAFTVKYMQTVVNVFKDIELTGFPFDIFEHKKFVDVVDLEYLAAEAAVEKLDEVKRFLKINKLKYINLNSHPQIRKLLFGAVAEGGMELEPVKKSLKTGAPSTDAASLKVLAIRKIVVAEKLLHFRKMAKLKSTFGAPYMEYYCLDTGAIHPNYFLAKIIDDRGGEGGASTGRLSCKKPNLQQIPKRDAEGAVTGKMVRRSFVPRYGEFLVEIDQSQVELRVAAMYSGDKTMIKLFKSGGDYHTNTAAEVHGVDLEDVTDAQRFAAKTVNFGLLFGMGIPKLARETGMDEDTAKKFLEEYFNLFPDLMKWREYIIEEARTKGYVTTLFGRKRMLKMAGYDTEDGSELRQGVNTPIQSAAAEITLYGLSVIWKYIRNFNLTSRLVGSIHDSGLLTMDYDEATTLLPVCIDSMERPPGLEWLFDYGVPLSVGVEVGPNLLDMIKVDTTKIVAGEVSYRDIIASI
jgi:DNA polymerase-1